MNIFYLSTDPQQCAEWHVDKHVVKMILEHTQLVSTLYRFLKPEISENSELDQFVYKSTHAKHPCQLWLREAYENYVYLLKLTDALNVEYKYRYNKPNDHKSYNVLSRIPPLQPNDFPDILFTTPKSCMADAYKIGDDPIYNYQNYYRLGKNSLAKWTKRSIPHWFH